MTLNDPNLNWFGTPQPAYAPAAPDSLPYSYISLQLAVSGNAIAVPEPPSQVCWVRRRV